MAKKGYINIVIISLILLTSIFLVQATTYKLLCLDKGQTVKFSQCNNAIPDRTCTSSTGCQYCVSVLSNNAYCPADLNICNTQGFACSSMDNSTVPAQNTSTTSNTTLQITNIGSTPNFPIINNQSAQNIKIQFTSNIYPITVTFKLYNIDSTLLKTTGPTTITTQSQIPITYQIPAGMSLGSHVLTMTVANSQKSQTFTLGGITVQSTSQPPIQQNNTQQNTTQQNTTQTQQNNTNSGNTNTGGSSSSGSSGGGGGGSSSSSTSSNSQNSNSNTNSGQTITGSATNNQNNQGNNPTTITTQNTTINQTSEITGKAIQTISTGTMTIALIVILAIALIYLFFKKRKSNHDPIQDFKI